MSSARGAFLLVDESSGDTIAETRVGGLMEMGSLVVDDVVVTPSKVGLLATHSVTDGRLVSLQKLKVGLFGAAYADGLLYVACGDGAQWLFKRDPDWDPSRSRKR